MSKLKNPYVIVGLVGLGIYIYTINKKKKHKNIELPIQPLKEKKENKDEEELKPAKTKPTKKPTEITDEDFADKFKIPVSFIKDTENLTTKEKAEIVVANINQLNKQSEMTQDERQTLIRMVNYLEYVIEKEIKEKDAK